MPLVPSRRACLAAAALFTMPVCGVAQGATALNCLPPVPPAPVTDAATRAEYRAEIGQEFTAYFDEAQAYLRCLDAARAEVSEEINRAISDYQALNPDPAFDFVRSIRVFEITYQQRRSSDGDCNSWGAVYMGTYGAQGEYSRRRSSVSAVPTASDLSVPSDCRNYWHRSVFVEWRDYEGSYGHEEVHY